jgi:hypothetical protein
MISEYHAAALDFASRGIPVFPLKPDDGSSKTGKEPFISNWYERATTDINQINSWWTNYPLAGIGHPPGRLGNLAVDLDLRKPGTQQRWAKLCADNGLVTDQSTGIHRTWSGGFHVFLQGTLQSGTDALGEGIDIKSVGNEGDSGSGRGYVVMPPTRVAGVPYMVVNAYHPNRGPLVPEWMRTLRDSKHGTNERMAALVEDLDLDVNVQRAREHMRDWVKRGLVAVQGRSGNARILEAGNWMGDFGLSYETAVEVLAEEWYPHCTPNHKADSLRRIVANAYHYRKNEIGSAASAPLAETFGTAVRDHGPKAAFSTYAIAEWWDAEPIEFWDTGQMFPKVPEGYIGFLSGQAKHGKTLLLIAAIMDMIADKSRPCPKVLYCAGEGARTLGIRIRALAQSRGLDKAVVDDHFRRAKGFPRIAEDGKMVEFAAYLAGLKADGWIPDIIIFDTLATALAGAEEDIKSAALFTSTGNVGKLAAMTGAVILTVAHWGHRDSKGQLVKRIRGTSGFDGNKDFELQQEKYPNEKPEDDHKPATAMKLSRTDCRDDSDHPVLYYEIAYLGRVPIPQRIDKDTYDVLTKKDSYEPTAIGSKLTTMAAFGPDKAVSTKALAWIIHPQGRRDIEVWTGQIDSLVRRLEGSREALQGYNNYLDGGGRGNTALVWYLPLPPA